MDAETIRQNIARLHPVLMDYEVKNDQAWVGNDGEAHYAVTRARLPTVRNVGWITLAVSGDPASRIRLASEFREVLGDPMTINAEPEAPGHTDFIHWLETSS